MKTTFTFEVVYEQYDTFTINAKTKEEALETAIRKAEDEGDGNYAIFEDDNYNVELAAG